MAAGSIVISLLMLTGSFETDTKKAERALNKLQKEAAETGKVIGTALAAGAIAAAYAFDQLIKGAARFKDLEETTGASAEDLASLAIAAETAGVGMETLAANSIRLTKNLTGVDDESKAAGAAIQALGLDLAAFKALDPVAQVDALTKAFAGFAGGSEKTAVATALWGKSGAEMLKVMKALEEQGGRTKILTQAQIEQADAYADSQAKATAELRQYAQAAATQGLPALVALTGAAGEFVKSLIGVDEETGRLGRNTAVRDFAVGAAQTIGFLIDAGDGVIRIFQGIGLAIGGLEAARLSVLKGEFRQARNILAELGADLDALAMKPFFSDGLNARLGAPAPQPAGPDTRPRLNFNGAVTGGKAAKEEIDKVAKALDDLEQQLALFGQDDAFDKAFKLEGLGATTEQLAQYRKQLSQLDELKTAAAIEEAVNALVRERDALGLTSEQLTIHKLVLQHATEEQLRYAQGVLDTIKAAHDQQAAIEEGKRVFEQTRTPAEALSMELVRLNDLLQRGAIDWDTYSRAVFAAQDAFDKSTKKVETQAEGLAKKFAENMQDLLGQGLYDMMTGNFKNIGQAFSQMVIRMVAEAEAANLARALFGGMVSGGSGGGILGSLVSSFAGFLFPGAGSGLTSNFSTAAGISGGRADGGSVDAGRAYLVGERGPELFTPRTQGTVLPAPATAQLMRGGAAPITMHFAITGPVDRRTQEQIAAAAVRGLAVARARGTA